MNDQCGWYSAPSAIHCLSVSFCAAVSFLFVFGGGITSSASSREDARDQLALVRLAGHDRPGLDGVVALVEPQVGLAGGAVRAVAGEAVLGQDRPDVAVVFELVGPVVALILKANRARNRLAATRLNRIFACIDFLPDY